MEDHDSPPIQVAMKQPTPAPAADEMLPTIDDHAERLQLKPWQVKAVVARMHGAHEDGERVYAVGVDLNTRISEADFDEALDEALHGRV